MLKKVLGFGVVAAVVAGLSVASWSQSPPAATPLAAGAGAKSFTFNNNDALTGWRIVGDAAVDLTKPREAKGGSLKVPPGAKATIKLGAADGGGKVEMWIYDDGTTPADPKAGHTGPRWGIVQSDGTALAVGILYASYLAGDEGYTASATDGAAWFEKLFWLAVERKPTGWHQWTFDFDADKRLLKILRDGKDVPTDESHWKPAESGITGFNAITIWGDGADKGQTLWVADVTYTPAAGGKATATKPAN